jgi:CRISPR-associated protein Cas6
MQITEPSPVASNSLSLPYVELSFRVMGQTLPADHGYGLYSAIAHRCPEIHGLESISIQTVYGIPDRKGKIYLNQKSRLRIRVSIDQFSMFYSLAGRNLAIGGHQIQLDVPQIFTLQSSSQLRARIVTIKGFQESELLLDAVNRQLQILGIAGKANILLNPDGEVDRKTIKIKRFSVVGFGVEVRDLSKQDSIKLQVCGLGGKRKMGCGVFVPLLSE